jgi:hypothetical protein
LRGRALAAEYRVSISRRAVFILIFILGAGLRAIDVWRPADGRMNDVWRECDVSAVARNFDREGMNILYPRVDWRGTGPGYAEMELPVLSWMMAAVYRVTGVHEVVGRIIEYTFSLVALGVALALLGSLLPIAGMAAGGLFFAISPLPIRIATSLQPEGLMFTCYVIAGYAFLRWLDTNTWRDYFLAAGATALAILAKSPAAHIGVFFLIMLLARRGVRVFADWRIWVFGVATLLPGALWYLHAHQFYLDYGNSLGLSNERHWIHADFFTNPAHVKNLARLELVNVWGYVGVAVAAAGVALAPRSPAVTIGLAWLASVLLFYVIAEHTLAEQWAVYYHVVSTPSAAILFGAGASAILDKARAGSWLWAAAGLCIPATLAAEGYQVVQGVHPHAGQSLYACAKTFAPQIAPGALILSTGGNCTDAEGEAIQYNASYMFYWVDRKGFSICRQGQSVDSVAAFAARGAQYFIAERRLLDANPGLEDQLKRRYAAIAECPVAVLFDLRPRP